MTDWTGVKLFHYTNYASLQGIIENKEMWLSNVRSMNDKTEMTHFMNFLKKAVKDECIGKEDEIDALFDLHQKRLTCEQAYSISFSKRYDDAAQWDRYGNRGMGVCIVFDAKVLAELVKNKAAIQPVFYSNDMSSHKIKDLIVYYVQHGKLLGNFKCIDEVFENAWIASAAYKHFSFEQESEVRVCMLPFYARHYGVQAKYKMEDWGIREYFPLDLRESNGKLTRGLIIEIMIGSNVVFPEGVFERYLDSQGIDTIKISYSECPLR